jgi:hypothetical protein
MRADSYSRTCFCNAGSARYLAIFLLSMLFLSGCKTQKDSADPDIIGVPPEDAYLGVEYSYNFGAFDADDILDYSLTNAPTWLALEDINNKARQGVIMRGVPGITGGQRGRDDLGRTTRINLVGNDRETKGIQPFSVDVQENQLSVVSQDYSESGSGDESDNAEERRDFQCEKPFTGETGEQTYSINVYDDSGAVVGTEEKTSVTRPVLVQVNLDQPSVTRIRVAFEIRSNFDPDRCDQDFDPPHQRCDISSANSDEAIIGRDIVALGSGSESALPTPDYVDYQTDANGLFSKGVLTLEPGITECYVRLEVIDDNEPEGLEAFTFVLSEVRSGIAGLGTSSGGVRESMRIEDNEPTVSLRTAREGKRDVVSLGTTTEYVATIEGDRDQTYFAKIGARSGSDATQGSDFELELETEPGSGVWEDSDLIEFPVGTDEVAFRVRTTDSASYNNTGDNDRFILLGLNAQYQAGRTNHAASVKDDELRISINELLSVPRVGADNGFVPTDMAIGQNGRVFISGYDSTVGNIPKVQVYDQKGNQVSDTSLFPRGISLDAPPVIDVSARDIEFGGEDVLRYEFAVSFGVEEDSAGDPTPDNVNIVAQRWFFDESLTPSDYARDWQLINGSDEDDLPRWVGLSPVSGVVLVSGVTKGVFEPDGAVNGRFGSFVQRIDTQEDGASLVPAVAWIRKVESTSHDERVVGGGIQNSRPLVIGDSSGSVQGESQFGGTDAFFYTAQSGEDQIDVQQVGTESDENLADGFFNAGVVWLIGNGTSNYRVATEQGVKVLRRTATDSNAGFALGYTPAGSAMEAYLLNGPGDQSNENLRAAMIFDGDLVAGGSTTGGLTDDPAAQMNSLEDPAIFRRNRQPQFEEDDEENIIPEPSQEWDRQLAIADPDTGVVEALVNYRDDEITALIRRNSSSGTEWTLNLFNAEGDPVNSP